MFLSSDTSQNAHYAQVPTISRQRNSFSIAEKHVTTMQFDYLFPMFHKYIYPGDTLSIQMNQMVRLQTQVSDLFDDLYIDLHAWFVPMRLIHNNWARFQFNTKETINQDNSGLTTPKIDLSTIPGGASFPAKGIYDYFGFPTKATFAGSTQHINNYLGRAYNLIWNENYRDENLQNPVPVDKGDGPDNVTNYNMLRRGKRHDKFTSALPFLQKGNPVGARIMGTAPVTTTGQTPRITGGGITNANLESALSPSRINAAGNFSTVTTLAWGDQTGLQADMTAGLSYMLINDLRLSASVQQLLEADARGGTRDVESIMHRWGVQVPDFRMQRPEYLGGTTFDFDGTVVPATAGYTTGSDELPQAHLTAFSQAMNSFNVTHSFVEHGVFMILSSARSNITYQQGLQRELSYKTRFDFYQPEFANIGEVAVKSKEVEWDGYDATGDTTFGYQEYAYELRYGENRVTSEMRSSHPQSLDYKHMATDFGGSPTLNSGFITSTTAIDRNIVVASGTSDPIQVNMVTKGTIARTLPMFSIPGITRL